MKLLVIADEEDKGLWDFFSPEKTEGIDAIISCGDLKPEYLSFLVTMVPKPLFYVHGNHDGKYERFPPEGCQCIEDDIVTFKGYRILGLGGCMCYNHGGHQYTEQKMWMRVLRLKPKLWKNKGFDILVTHSPARGVGDGEDLCHRGFEAFTTLIDKFHPLYHFHGHVHLSYSCKNKRTVMRGDTTVINACGKYIVELPDRE